jgi:putative DNA primase/helicase
VVNLAQELRCAVLGVSHFSKGTAGRDPIERVTGSIAFGALPRVVFATAKRPEEDGGGRILVRAKTNIGPEGDGFLYELAQASVPGHPGLTASQVRWGRPLIGAARDLLASAETTLDAEERSATDEAVEWLADLLAGGAMPAADVLQSARKAGLTDKALRRAREKLGIKSRKQGGHFGGSPGWVWELPALKMPSTAEDAQPAGVGIFREEGHLQDGPPAEGSSPTIAEIV